MRVEKSLSALFAVLSLITVVTLSSCNVHKNQGETTTRYEYTPVGQETTEAATEKTEEIKEIVTDTSWQKNFRVSYRYFDPEQSLTTMKIEEKKSSGAFTVENSDTGSIQYYKANGNDTDCYVIIESEEKQVHSVLTGKKLSTLSSMFMKLSDISRDFPSKNNVLYMYNETVAGRNCHKFIQRAYSDGELTQSVYVWVDVQYGFVAKCESYDADNTLNLMWEIESFETGKLKDEDVMIDVSKYDFGVTVG